MVGHAPEITAQAGESTGSSIRKLEGGWLIYHPKRHMTRIDDLTVYHDSLSGNQDPYVWNRQFLHTACHMPQMSPQIGDINFWVSGDTFPAFTQLWCDLVFVVQDKVYWTEQNSIEPQDLIVESTEAFADHYAWMPKDHPYKKLRRFTLKADPGRSFQPQSRDQTLIDIVPLLESVGLSLNELRTGLRAGFQSKPLRLPQEMTLALYDSLVTVAPIRLSGDALEAARKSVHGLYAELPA
jgi:hypothetical protein